MYKYVSQIVNTIKFGKYLTLGSILFFLAVAKCNFGDDGTGGTGDVCGGGSGEGILIRFHVDGDRLDRGDCGFCGCS